MAVAFHAGLFNIGSEGQAYVGGLGAALVALSLDQYVPWYVTMPFAVIGAAVFGAAWAFIPAWLQAKRGSHIVITTIMFNFIGAALMVYLLVHVLIVPGKMAPETRTFLPGGQLPKLDWLMALFGLKLGPAPFNVSFLIALLMCFLVWVLIWRSKLGYEMRTLASPLGGRICGYSVCAHRHHRHAHFGWSRRNDGSKPGHGLVRPPAGGIRRWCRLRRYRRIADGT